MNEVSRCEDLLATHPDVFVLISVLSTSGDVEGTARQQVFSVCYQLGETVCQVVVLEHHARARSDPKAAPRQRDSASYLSVESLELVKWKCDRTGRKCISSKLLRWIIPTVDFRDVDSRIISLNVNNRQVHLFTGHYAWE